LQTANSGSRRSSCPFASLAIPPLMFARVITESVGGLVANLISESRGPASRNESRLP
jgi:hypothetical protein